MRATNPPSNVALMDALPALGAALTVFARRDVTGG